MIFVRFFIVRIFKLGARAVAFYGNVVIGRVVVVIEGEVLACAPRAMM
jgi:hypothetical protein